MQNTSYHQARIDFAQRIYDNPGMLPHRYVFVLTNRCNLRCSFCFQEKDFINGSLSTDDWLRLVRQLPDYAHVTLTGGEPFIFKGFRDVFMAVTERHTCNVISNGLLLTEELIDLLLSRANFKVLSISVDNIRNTVRDVVPEQWRKTEEMMLQFTQRRNALGSDAVLDSKTVVLDDNAPDLLAIHRYCVEQLSCDTHSFMLLKGAPIQYADHMFPLEAMFQESNAYVYQKFSTVLEQFEQVRLYNRSMGKRCFTHPKVVDLNGPELVSEHDLGLVNRADHVDSHFRHCKAPWESVHINVDGNLFPCMAISMGNVKEKSVAEIVSGPVFMKFKEEIRRQGTVAGCNRCGYLLPK
jgi:MoaA/NifB/PqqE/SkfB family radical SAM enzyme